MKAVLIDYGSGNLRSAAKAFERAASQNALDAEILVSGNPDDLESASHIILPGVGAFGDCRKGLDEVPGMVEALEKQVHIGGKPFLGICVGMQLMAQKGLEHGVHDGFGWIKGEVRAMAPSDPSLKIPHMGWNNLEILSPHPVLSGLDNGTHVYFVHSYEMCCSDKGDVIATTDYGGPVTAAVARDNLIGTQFHPEKSQAAGLQLIANFLKWRP